MDALKVNLRQPPAKQLRGAPLPPSGRARTPNQAEGSEPTSSLESKPASTPETMAASSGETKPDENEARRLAQELAVRFDLKVEVVKDDKTGQDVLRVMSPDGKRLLRQFPPEAVLALAERLRRGATDGLLTSLA